MERENVKSNVYCAQLRRRSSFAPIVPRLTAQDGLGATEAKLETHDISITLSHRFHSQQDSTSSKQDLRLLLFSPSAVTEAALTNTIDRMQCFAKTADTESLAIFFLLSPPLNSSFRLAKHLIVEDESLRYASSQAGMHAYQKLQVATSDIDELADIPFLPITSLDCFLDVVERYTHSVSIGRSKQIAKPWISSFELLKQCTANPPMPDQTAFILSNRFASIAKLADFCGKAACVLGKSENPARIVDPQSSQMYSSTDELAIVKALIGEERLKNIIDFWRKERSSDVY